MKLFFVLLAICTSFISTSQSYFKVEQEYPDGYNGQYSVDLATLPAYGNDQIEAAFNELTKSAIYFHYPQGACQNRAEMMHIILDKQLKMPHAKIWIFAPIDLFENDSTYLEIADPNGLATNNIIKWQYHVAPYPTEQPHLERR